MSNTNGFHPSSSSMSDSGINDTVKRMPSTTAVNKRLKSKNVMLITVNETRSMKRINKKQKSIDLNKKHLIHSDSNNNNNSTKKVKQHSHSPLEHIPSTSSNKTETHHIINNHYCHSCGEYNGELISCDTCQSTFHLLCANTQLSKEDDLPKNSYFCDNCRTIRKTQEDLMNKDKQQKLILPFRFDPKKTLHINGFKRNQQNHSTLEQIKLPTASNGRSLIQPSGEIKFRAKSTNKTSTSNLKRKRIDSSSSPPPSSINSPILNLIKIPNTQLDVLHRLFLSCQSEDFHGPLISSNYSTYHVEKYCFICRKSSTKQGPSIHCDYCPLTYHLDCLTPPMTSLPLSNDKWMCPNHMEPILDRYLTKKKTIPTNERVKFYHQYSKIQQNTIIQEFTQRKHAKDSLSSNIINNHRLERIHISQIPKAIEEFYLTANTGQKQICKIETNDRTEEKHVQIALPPNESSSLYDPCIWDILQAILDHIVNDDSYEFSSPESLSIENDHLPTESSSKNECDTLDRIDILLQTLNDPNSTSEQCTLNKTNGLDALIAASSCEEKPKLTNSFSLLIDLSQFHFSHAALIHLRSQHVIYIRKHVIWFGSSPLNDIYLKDFNHSPPCQYISERHACLYYDRQRNLFELLNYSEYGTIVNDLRYGLDIPTNDDDNNKQENDNLQKCYCLIQSPSYQSAWDGPAQIEQGTVIKIGCHEFLFYRHIVR